LKRTFGSSLVHSWKRPWETNTTSSSSTAFAQWNVASDSSGELASTFLLVHKKKAYVAHDLVEVYDIVVDAMSRTTTCPDDCLLASPLEIFKAAVAVSRRSGLLVPRMVDTDLAFLLNEREEASLSVCEDLWWQQRRHQARGTPNLFVFLGDNAEKHLS
jgi:hypothetical protein